MTSAPDNTAKTWRDLADQLSPEQIVWLEGFERDNPDTAETGASMLDLTREWAAANLAAVAVFGGVPMPADAVKVSLPSLDEGGLWQRLFSGTTRTVADFEVFIEGEQMPSGAAHRWIALDAESVPSVGGTLTVELARTLAAALIEAADEVAQLAAGDGVTWL